MIELKSVQLSGMKADDTDGLEAGEFEAYASTWIRTPDSYGDVVKKGAFAETIREWKASGNTLPILFGHDLADPFSNIGGALELREDDRGLLVRGRLDLDNPKANQVYKMVKGRRLTQLSFAYDVLEDGIVELDEVDPKTAATLNPRKKTARELRKMKLHEISLVPFGANADTEVLAVKALAAGIDGLKAGRVLSAKNLESLIAARDSLSTVIKAAGEDNDSDDEASSAAAGEDEAQAGKSSLDLRTKSALAMASFTASL